MNQMRKSEVGPALFAASSRRGVSSIDLEGSAVDLDEHAACDRALEKAGNDSGAALAGMTGL